MLAITVPALLKTASLPVAKFVAVSVILTKLVEPVFDKLSIRVACSTVAVVVTKIESVLLIMLALGGIECLSDHASSPTSLAVGSVVISLKIC